MKLVANIQNRACEQFYRYCQTKLVPMMQLDVSRYAPNRYRLWLLQEPHLGSQPKLKKADDDPYLNQVIQGLYPGCNTALISYHGQIENVNSDARINHHRDTSFASNTICLWIQNRSRDNLNIFSSRIPQSLLK